MLAKRIIGHNFLAVFKVLSHLERLQQITEPQISKLHTQQ